MRYTQLILSLFLLFTFVIALPMPAPVEAVAAQDAANKKKPKNGAKGNKGATTKKPAATANNGKKPATNAKQDCVAAKNLAAGIENNISIQKQEQIDVAAVKKIVDSKNPNTGDAKKAIAKLKTTVKDGITVRENNQKMSKGNPAAAGLSKVAEAQKTELNQVNSLKGTPADLPVIDQLVKEFAAGIKQNQQNKKDAVKGC